MEAYPSELSKNNAQKAIPWLCVYPRLPSAFGALVVRLPHSIACAFSIRDLGWMDLARVYFSLACAFAACPATYQIVALLCTTQVTQPLPDGSQISRSRGPSTFGKARARGIDVASKDEGTAVF